MNQNLSYIHIPILKSTMIHISDSSLSIIFYGINSYQLKKYILILKLVEPNANLQISVGIKLLIKSKT